MTVKRLTSCLLVLALFVTLLPLPTAAAQEGVLTLPSSMTEIEDEAFMGDTSFTTLVIPKTVEKIGSRAFVGCTNLRAVYFGNSTTVSIAKDAFDQRSDLVFNVFPQSKGELYALSHGASYELIDPETGSAAYQRAMALVAQNGGFSTMQSGEWASQRLIVMRADGKLPNISAFQPSEIIKDGNIFFIQFDDEGTDNTIGCYSALLNDPNTVFVEADQYVEGGDDVSAAGVVDANIWGTSDPMGFDVYAPFVADNAAAGDSVTIAIVDSGVKRLSSYAGKLRSDGVNMLAAVDGEDWSADYANHGSYIASVIADCVGSANVLILPVRVLGSNKYAESTKASSFSAIGYGIRYAVEHGASIINLSQNFKESKFVTQMINEAISEPYNAAVVVAAGNDHFTINKIYPANLAQVVTVGGLSQDYQLSSNTNYGTGIDYTAPDSYIQTSAYPGQTRPGTSFSAPMIASALALVRLDPYHGLDDLTASCYITPEAGDLLSSYGSGMPRLDLLANIAVDSVAFDASLPEVLKVGDVLPLSWTVSPVKATDKTVGITSSDEDVLALVNDETGSVSLRALTAGNATVKLVSNSNRSASASKTFTVVQPVTSISISGADKLVLPRRMQLTASVQPANANYRALQWHSSNPAVATVDENGYVESLAEGRTRIYATALDGYGAISNELEIEVVSVPDAAGLILTIDGRDVTDGDIVMAPGESRLISVRVLPDDAPQEYSFRAVGNRVSVTQDGVLTANSSGMAMVEVTSSDGNASATINITVIVPPASVSIEGASGMINEGQQMQLSATVLPTNADDRTVSWSSSNPSVASVNGSGLVTGVSIGTATIIASANGDPGKTAQVTVTVKRPYTLNFDLNAGGDLAAYLYGDASRTAYSGEAINGMPTASRDYYDFLGWYTQAGDRIADGGVINTTDSYVTLYAHWSLHPESDWVTASSVPSNATVTQTSYSYRIFAEHSDPSAYSSWVNYGNYWKETGSGWSYYASFPSSYSTSNTYYKEYMHEPYSAYENDSSKRTVSNVQEGWIYWHWMYNVAYANNTTRAISYEKKDFGSQNCCYFHAMASNTDCPYLSKDYCHNQNKPSYNARSVILEMTTSSQRENGKSGIGTNRYFRTNRMKSSYVDYTKYYQFYQDQYYSSTPASTWQSWGYSTGSQTTYYKYRVK